MDNSTHDPFLNNILSNIEIKTEPEEIQETYPDPQNDEILITPFEPSCPPSFTSHDKNIEVNNNKQETVEIPSNPQITETDYIQKRAQAIRQREASAQMSSIYVNIPPKSTPIIPQSTQSPLNFSAYNMIGGFQASTDNVKQVVVNANPNSHIPFEVQQTARRLGADLDKIISRDPRLQKKNAQVSQAPPRRETIACEMPLNVSISQQFAPRPAIVSPPVIPRIPVIQKKDAEVQTTTNDGKLRFEITTQELMDLPREKLEILMEFKKVSLNDKFQPLVGLIYTRNMMKIITSNFRHSTSK